MRHMTVLGVDIGTTSMKMGVFRLINNGIVEKMKGFSANYQVNVYNQGTFGDIEQEKWQSAFRQGCTEMADFMPDIEALSLSGTTPGLSAMDPDGNPTYPAILMLDQRSRKEAGDILRSIGLPRMLAETANVPAAGGCSLASILWIRDHEPEAFRKTACFGHSNTFIAKWLTGRFAIDPSSASLSALYNTVKNDLTWSREIASSFNLDTGRLPELIPSHESAGRVKEDLAAELGLAKRPPVIIGGNDAVLAAYDAGVCDPGQAINVNGTCEITLVCLPKCYPSTEYNIRAHVIPNRWLTLYVMNAGGKAFEWFQQLFCSEMTVDQFWSDFLPGAVEKWLKKESLVRYTPYLLGSRYSLEPLRAEFTGMNQETGREEVLAALVRGLCEYQRKHLQEISSKVPLEKDIFVTGGALNDILIKAKQLWMRDCNYKRCDQSSLRGAALLAKKYLAEH